MTLLHLIVTIVALFAISRAYLRWKDGKLSNNELGFWTAIWIAAVVVVFHPQITMQLSDYFGIGRGIDLVIYASIVLLFYLMFRIYVKLETIEQDFTKLVREITFINAEQEHEKAVKNKAKESARKETKKNKKTEKKTSKNKKKTKK